MSLLDECIAAHGGDEAFDALAGLCLRLRCGGLALASRGQRHALADVRADVGLHRPRVAFEALGTWTGEQRRPTGMAWRIPWTSDDVVHFAGYALWNYLAAPFAWRDCRARELSGRRIELTFPESLTTHSRRQVAHLDEHGRIRRLDYTAEVFGPWARAQNVCLEYQRCAGVLVAVRRRVTPRGMPAPTLVSIELSELVSR